MSDRFSGYPATIHFGSTEVDLRQLQSHQFSPNGTKSFQRPGGSADRKAATLANAKPVHRFTTLDLETIFNNIGSVATGIDSTAGIGPSATWRWQQRGCSSDFQASANNVHINMATDFGYIKPVSLSSSEDNTDGALVTLEYYSVSSNGTDDPDNKTTGALTGAPSPAFNSQYFHGPTYYNGAAVNGIDGCTIDFGINATVKLFGNVFPTCYAVETRDPRMTLTGTKSNIDSALSQYINDISTSWTQYLRKGLNKNSRVADGTAAHISAVVTSGEWCVDDSSWQDTGDNQVSVTVEAVDGLVAIGVDVTIP